MILLEFKIKAKPFDIDEGSGTVPFIGNKSLRYGMEHKKVSKYALNKYSSYLADEFRFRGKSIQQQDKPGAAPGLLLVGWVRID